MATCTAPISGIATSASVRCRSPVSLPTARWRTSPCSTWLRWGGCRLGAGCCAEGPRPSPREASGLEQHLAEVAPFMEVAMRISGGVQRKHPVDVRPDRALFAQVYELAEPLPEDRGRCAEVASDETRRVLEQRD